MQQALCIFQPACVLCGAADDLTTHHVQPLGKGRGLKPGNAVRLCRACNSFIWMRSPSELSPEQARKIETAAARFKEFWDSGCSTGAVHSDAAVEHTSTAPDPALVSLLRAVERGDDDAVSRLSDWLDDCGDPRAAAIRDVTRLQPIFVGETRVANELQRSVAFELDGKRYGPVHIVREFAGEAEASLAHAFREARRRRESSEVWQRLGLTTALSNTLKQYLGINSDGLAATVGEIAHRAEMNVQTIRNRIELGMHRLLFPTK